jgi:hypothetical protein
VVFRRRGSVLLALVVASLGLLGLGLWGAVGFASPKDNDDGHHNDKGRTLTVVSKNREVKVVDLGPQGTSHGDMRVINAPLYDASGKERIGRFDYFVVLTDPADESGEKAHVGQATYTLTLPGGEITAQGQIAFPKFSERPPGGVNAITGGTGKYAGVGGEERIEPRGNKIIGTLHFVD